MPDAYTPVLGLAMPEVGASRDSWGAKWNNNATILDQFVSQACPIGIIADFAGASAPSGWLICDGRVVSRVTYSDLYSIIGTIWGPGDGSTTFRLPNVAGRSLVGPGTVTDQGGLPYNFGFTQMQGYVYSPITQNNLPNYAITIDVQGNHNHGSVVTSAGPWLVATDAQGSHQHGGTTTTENVNHTHTGYTDTNGDHAHTVDVPVAGHTTPGGGNSPGASGATWTTSVDGMHAHNVQTYGASGPHTHQINWDGTHTHGLTVPAHQHAIYWDGAHSHNASLGGGGVPITVLNPFLVVTKIIYAGTQASTSAATASEAVALAVIDDELAEIKAELARLRAMIAVPARRVISAPSRGMH